MDWDSSAFIPDTVKSNVENTDTGFPAISLLVELTVNRTLLWLPGAIKPELIGKVKSLVSKASKESVLVVLSIQDPVYDKSNVSGPLPVLVIDTVTSWLTLPNNSVVPSESMKIPNSWLTVILALK